MHAAVVETHTSTLLFLGDRVYKCKKPLDLGFSDFRSLEARQLACEEEVRLNRRLAPDVYDGVATVLDPDGRQCEALVVMRRLPEETRLSTLVAAGVDVASALDAIAAQLWALHERSPAGPEGGQHASAETLAGLWQDGCDVLGRSPGVPRHLVDQLREQGSAWLAAHVPLLVRRGEQTRVVDGHGDLLADDVFVLDDGPRVLDCLEFDAGLRTVDGLHDACSLAMDLERIGAPGWARRFLETYRSLAADDAPASLEHFFIAYRALVRAKVACLRAAQGDEGSTTHALLLAALCRDHLESATGTLVLVGGLPGSGKSTVAAGVAAARGARLVSTDRVRTGLSVPTTGRYTDAARDVVYQSVLEVAADGLGLGEDVVLDATFSNSDWRAQARALATQQHAHVKELLCTAPDGLAADRLRTRPAGDSEATPLVRLSLADRWDPWPEAATVDCSGSGAQAVSQALRLVRTSSS